MMQEREAHTRQTFIGRGAMLKQSQSGNVVPSSERMCRVCGCTDDNACMKGLHGACYWVEADLCSECKSETGESGE